MSDTLIIFGDGQQALYYDEKVPIQNKESVRVRPILLSPSEELKAKHNIKDEDMPIITDDNRKAIWMEYPVEWMEWLNKSIRGGVLLIDCAFNADRTPHMNKYNELLELHAQRDITEARLRFNISSLQRELEDVTSNQINLLANLKQMQEVITEKREEEGGEGE